MSCRHIFGSIFFPYSLLFPLSPLYSSYLLSLSLSYFSLHSEKQWHYQKCYHTKYYNPVQNVLTVTTPQKCLKFSFFPQNKFYITSIKTGGITTVFTSRSSASWKIYEKITVFVLNKNKTSQDLFFSYVHQEVRYVSGVPTYLTFKFRKDAWHTGRLHYDFVCGL